MQVSSGKLDIAGLVWELQEACLDGSGSAGRKGLFLSSLVLPPFLPRSLSRVLAGSWTMKCGHEATKPLLACMETELGFSIGMIN